MSKSLKIGDIFYLKLKEYNLYVFGRLLFDVKKQYNKKTDENLSKENYFPYLLMVYKDCQLVEMYDGVYDQIENFDETAKIIIPQILTLPVNSSNNILEWGVVGYKEVDFKQIDFQENLNIESNKVILDRGEISIETKLKNTDDQYESFNSETYVPATIAYASLHFQNRRELIPEDARWPEYIKDMDLHYHSDLRNSIYKSLGLDPKKSYYELSKEMGFDLARFYEK